MFGKGLNCPELVFMNSSEDSVRAALGLTAAPRKVVVRLTGGCALSPRSHGKMAELFLPAFSGFEGGLLFGGTRSVLKARPTTILPSITEMAPLIAANSARARVLGIVPRVDPMIMMQDFGLVVEDKVEDKHRTVIHPSQNMCLIVQRNCDRGAIWEDERLVAESIVRELSGVGWLPVLVAYNGGKTTRNEIQRWANLGWPVVLIKGSGRSTDKLIANEKFLETHQNVKVVSRTSESLRESLIELGVLASSPGDETN